MPPQQSAAGGVIGAGDFSVSTVLPCLKQTATRLKYVCGMTNAHAVQHAAGRFAVENALTDCRQILDDSGVNTVSIVTGHHTYVRFGCEALAAGKHVFVEKPLCIDEGDLEGVSVAEQKNTNRLLMVGFNRRFSPHTLRIKQALTRGRRSAGYEYDS